jgi:hypothetical protein
MISEVPRVEAQTSKAGYREGVASARDLMIQAGFDNGRGVGGEIGGHVGLIFSKLNPLEESAENQLKSVEMQLESAGSTEHPYTNKLLDVLYFANSVKSSMEKARRSLAVEQVLGAEFFTEDGQWNYPVLVDGGWTDPVLDRDRRAVTPPARLVAASHPSIQRWNHRANRLALLNPRRNSTTTSGAE